MSSGYSEPDPEAIDYYSRLGVPVSAEPEDIEEHAKQYRAEIEHEGGNKAANFRDALEVLTNQESYNNYKTLHKRFGSVKIATKAYEKWKAQGKPESPGTWMPPKEIVEEMEDPTKATPEDGSTTDTEQPDQTERRGRRGSRGEAGSNQTQQNQKEKQKQQELEPGNPNHPASAVNMEDRNEQKNPAEGINDPPGELFTSRYLIKSTQSISNIVPKNIQEKFRKITISDALISKICEPTKKVRAGYWAIFVPVLFFSTISIISLATGGSGGIGGSLRSLIGWIVVPAVSGAIVEDAEVISNPLRSSVLVVAASSGLAILFATVAGGLISVPFAVVAGTGGSGVGTAIGMGIGQSFVTPILFGILAAIVAGVRL